MLITKNNILNVKPNFIDKNNKTPLIVACENKLLNIALQLLDKDCNHGHIYKKTTALMYCCCKDMEEVALKLLDLHHKGLINCRPHYINSYHQTAFVIACKLKLNKIALKILDDDYICANIYEGDTMLLLACKNKLNNVALKLIDLMIKSKLHSQFKQFNNNGNTPLLCACENKLNNVALKLIDYSDVSQIFNNKYRKYTALIAACRNKMEDVALKLINKCSYKFNCLPQYTDNCNNSALIYACENNMENIALKLIDMDFLSRNRPKILTCIKIFNMFKLKQKIEQLNI